MLVLSRKPGETVRIGHWITVTVVEVHGNRVRLSFQAPRDVPINRQEIYEKLYGKEGVAENAVIG